MSSIKRMRITVEGKTYDVAVELLEDAAEPSGTPIITAPASIPGIAPRFTPPSAEPKAAPGAAGATSGPGSAGAAGATSQAGATGPRPRGAIVCPLSGMVLTVDVAVGQHVHAGDVLITLEAMKMKTPVRATSAGTVKSIAAKAGVAVEEGTVLLVLE